MRLPIGEDELGAVYLGSIFLPLTSSVWSEYYSNIVSDAPVCTYREFKERAVSVRASLQNNSNNLLTNKNMKKMLVFTVVERDCVPTVFIADEESVRLALADQCRDWEIENLTFEELLEKGDYSEANDNVFFYLEEYEQFVHPMAKAV